MAYRVFSALLLVALFAKETTAGQHIVGGSQGWDESTDFNSWASGQKFKVGDQLVFKYSSGLHSVVELTGESAYKKCDLGSTLDSMSTGKDVVKLDKPGTRYFACGTLGHCGQGMKVKITTETGTAPSTPESSVPAQASPASVTRSLASVILLVAIVMSTKLLYML